MTFDVGNAAFPIILGRSGHLGIVLAVVAALFVWWLLYRTTWGFEVRSVERIMRDTERDNFMSAGEAKAYGLIDEVLTGGRAG